MVRRMSLSRLASVVTVVLAATNVVQAQPKKTPAPVAPAKDAAPTTPPPAGDAPAPPADEPPPKDMNGVDENPDAPKTDDQPDPNAPIVPIKKREVGYPLEEALRPITLPQNMSEVRVTFHGEVSPADGAGQLRARYGITREIQLGLTYLFGAVYDDPSTQGKDYGVHPGKALGLDVTVLIQNWLGIRVGVPVYVNPVAVSLTIGAPIKFSFGDGKWAIGGLDDIVSIKLHRFTPSFDSELVNQVSSNGQDNHTIQDNGRLHISAYGIYQLQPNLAFIGRIGVDSSLGTSNNMAGASAQESGSATFVHAGLQFSPRWWADLGFSLGFDDLTQAGSFDPELYVVLRI
jgi:hypothetical protein